METTTYTFLVIGSGCREMQMSLKVKESKYNTKLYCISNTIQPQLNNLCEEYIICDTKNNKLLIETTLNTCDKYNIHYVLIGSEAILMTELVYEVEKKGIFCIAPNHIYARIETSKLYGRRFLETGKMSMYNPDYISITRGSSISYILDFLNKYNNQVVVKPDRPMGGKGVKVFGEHLYTRGEILEYISSILDLESETENIVLLEEKLVGKEFSFISLTDGTTTKHSFPIVDFKRLNEGNTGPNTGSMGCITDGENLKFLTDDDITIVKLINENTILGLNKQNHGLMFPDTRYNTIFNIQYTDHYKGFLYGSFIKTETGQIKVIEFNARLGDPEGIPFLRQLNIDFVDLCIHMENKSIHTLSSIFIPKKSLTQYIVPREYPNAKNKTDLSLKSLCGYEYKHILMGSIIENDNKDLEALTSRTLCIYADASHFTVIHNTILPIVERIMRVNKNKYHTRGDLLNCYLGDEERDKYKMAGVDIELGNSIVKEIGPIVKETYNDLVVNEIGSFGGCFSLPEGIKEPILVSSIDGVGTKSIVVENAMGVKGYYNLGQDIVNHCVNDILVQGASPLFFMDYIAASQLSQESVLEFVKGISYACKQVGCVLLGGETAEMPNVYQMNRYDLVGNIVGIVDKEHMICPEQTICNGDSIFALPSSGPHTNGYSLIRKIMKENPDKIDDTLLTQLCAPHKSYLSEIKNIQNNNIPIHGLCHVTGGGFHDNIVRILPDGLKEEFIEFEFSSLFQRIQKLGDLDRETMMRVFNCGWGMLIITSQEYKGQLHTLLPQIIEIGKIVTK